MLPRSPHRELDRPGNVLLTSLVALRGPAQWILYFGISFAITAGFLLLAHV